jgi:predicted small integral membrane protein
MNDTIIQEFFIDAINQTGIQAGQDISRAYWMQSAIIIVIALIFFLWITIAMFSIGVAGKKATKRSKKIYFIHIFLPFMLWLISTITIVFILLPRINLWLYT